MGVRIITVYPLDDFLFRFSHPLGWFWLIFQADFVLRRSWECEVSRRRDLSKTTVHFRRGDLPFFFSSFLFFFPHPINYLRRSLYLSLLVVTQIRGHRAGAPHLLITCLAFLSQLFLPSSTRVELCLPTLRVGTLGSFFFLQKKI